MKEIFGDLKKMGFDDLDDVTVFEKESQDTKDAPEKEEMKLEEVLYDKTYVCPVCNYTFKSKAVRSGKNKLTSTDTDLYSHYDKVNPIVYDCIMCNRCGYSAISKSFSKLTSKQIEWIKQEISSKYNRQFDIKDFFTEQDAIERYKLALLTLIVKKARPGEKAYICLRIAWLYRDLGDEKNEKVFLQHALQGFEEAYTKGNFPIYELNEETVAYLIAELNRRLGKYEDAAKWASHLILSPGISPRLKSRVQDLKDMINEDKNNKK